MIFRPFDPYLPERVEPMSSELPFRLRTVARLKAGENEPFAHADFDPILRERRPVATVSGPASKVAKAWRVLADLVEGGAGLLEVN